VSDALKLVFEYLAGALVLVFIFYFIFRSWQKALLFVFLLLCVQFFFGAVHDLLKNWLYTSFISKYSFLLPLILALIGGTFFFLLKTRRHFKKITQYLSITLVILIAVDLAVMVSKFISRSGTNKTITEITECRLQNQIFTWSLRMSMRVVRTS
jgi:hypothetical protein